MCDIEAHWSNQDDPEKTSLGIASLEAMAAGKPIFAAANPDTYGVGLLLSGKNCFIVKAGEPDALADSLVRLLLDDELRRNVGREAHAVVRANFLWDSVC